MTPAVPDPTVEALISGHEPLSLPDGIMCSCSALALMNTTYAAHLAAVLAAAPDAEVLVEGSFFPVADLPRILGNFMRAADEAQREAKELRAALVELKPARAAAPDALRVAVEALLASIDKDREFWLAEAEQRRDMFTFVHRDVADYRATRDPHVATLRALLDDGAADGG